MSRTSLYHSQFHHGLQPFPATSTRLSFIPYLLPSCSSLVSSRKASELPLALHVRTIPQPLPLPQGSPTFLYHSHFLPFLLTFSASGKARELSFIVYMPIIPIKYRFFPHVLCSTLAYSAFEPKSVRGCGVQWVGEGVLHLGSGEIHAAFQEGE